jgi:7-cyano-7-deazaguanine synthase
MSAEVPGCLVLFSGGLDSTTCLAIARKEGFEPQALIFNYGQRHAVEVSHALALTRDMNIHSRLVELDLRSVGGSALTSSAMAVPHPGSAGEIGRRGVPPTYVPARNTLFLAHALAWAEVLSLADIYIGVNSLDYSGYPDCRGEYLEAFERMANLALRSTTEGGVRLRIHAPLLRKTKAEIVRWGVALGVNYSRTWSCYDPQWTSASVPVSCGLCESCLLRKCGFREAGVPDPTVYSSVAAEEPH